MVTNISQYRVETHYASYQKPEEFFILTTDKDDWNACTNGNINVVIGTTNKFGAISGDVNILRIGDTDQYPTANIKAGFFNDPTRVANEDSTFATYAGIQAGTSGGYISIEGATNDPITLSTIRIKYDMVTGVTGVIKYKDSAGAWQTTGQAITATGANTITFTFATPVVSYGGSIRLEFSMANSSLDDVKIYQIWFNDAIVTGTPIFLGTVTDFGVFEADYSVSSSQVATVKKYLRFATTQAGLTSASYTEYKEDIKIDAGANTWCQWQIVLDRGLETDSTFLWGYPVLHYVKVSWLRVGYLTTLPVAVTFKDQYYLSMALTGVNWNQYILKYDKANQWVRYESWSLSALVVANNNFYGGRSYFSPYPYVWRLEYKNQDTEYSITCYWISRLEDFGDGRLIKNLRRGRIWQRSVGTGTLHCQVKLDEAGSFADFDTVAMNGTAIEYDPLWFAIGNQAYYAQFKLYIDDLLYNGDYSLSISGFEVEAKTRTLR